MIEDTAATRNYFYLLEKMEGDEKATRICLNMMTWLIKDIETSEGLDLKDYKDIWEVAYNKSLENN